MNKELTPEKIKLPKIKKLDDGVFCFENNEEVVFMPKSKYEENEKKLKALEIIKEKKWLVEDILNAFIEDKEKYDLLKEVLKWNTHIFIVQPTST